MSSSTRPYTASGVPSSSRPSSSHTANTGHITVRDERRVVEHVVNGRTVARYQWGQLLGKGGFAKCYAFTPLPCGTSSNAGSARLAGKVIPKASLTKPRHKVKLETEIQIHKNLLHKRVVRFLDYFEDADNHYILLELCEGRTVLEKVRHAKRLREDEARRLMNQILEATMYMHSQRVIHRDLKLGNLFLTASGDIKVGDFGLACRLDNEGEKKRTLCGTPNYIAPEVLDSKKGHSYEADVWSIGVILYTMLVGRPPFETSDVKQTYRRIRHNQYSFPDRVPISSAAKKLISSILCTDPASRPSLSAILRHPFISGVTDLQDATSNMRGLTLSSRYTSSTVSSGHTSERPPLRPLATQALSTVADTRDKPLSSRTASALSSARSTTAAHGMTTARASAAEEEEQLRALHRGVSSAIGAPANGTVDPSELPLPNVWVASWVDYSKKYGLGYRLSDSSVGVFFNDATKLIVARNGTTMDYVERVRRSDGSKKDVSQRMVLQDYPVELKKKVTLLHHFQSYLDNASPERKHKFDASAQASESCSVYVRKWMKTRHSIIFRLSNNNFQVNFSDHTEVLLWSDKPYVTYYGRNKVRRTYRVAEAQNFDELAKRVRYVRDILQGLLQPPSAKRAPVEVPAPVNVVAA